MSIFLFVFLCVRVCACIPYVKPVAFNPYPANVENMVSS